MVVVVAAGAWAARPAPSFLLGSLSLDFHPCGCWQPAPVRKCPPSSAGSSLQQPGSGHLQSGAGLWTCSSLPREPGARLNHHISLTGFSPVCARGKKPKPRTSPGLWVWSSFLAPASSQVCSEAVLLLGRFCWGTGQLFGAGLGPTGCHLPVLCNAAGAGAAPQAGWGCVTPGCWDPSAPVGRGAPMGAHGWGGSSPPTLLCALVPKATRERSKGKATCFIASGQGGRA